VTSRSQATRWRVVLRELRQFRAFCCDIDSDSIMGVAKQPVPHLSITPNPVCLGSPVVWSFAGSYAPGSTIVDYSIDMGDSTTYNASSGTHTYGSAGTYRVRGTVTEGLGKSTTIEVEVLVTDCSTPMLIEFAYTAYDGGGVYFIDLKAPTPAWEARNVGLEGDARYVRDLKLRPGHQMLPDDVHELWAATKGGVYRTYTGGRNWAKVEMPDPSNAEFDDTPPARVEELDWHNIVFDPVDPLTIYVLASKLSKQRVWVYKSMDYGATWISRGVVEE
jgi:hypothetical protein